MFISAVWNDLNVSARIGLIIDKMAAGDFQCR